MGAENELAYYSVLRRCVTGVNEYRYYHDGELIGGSAALVMPGYPVAITGIRSAFHCERDIESTVCPGSSNTIFSEAQEYAKIIYLGQGQHSLQIGTDKIWILSGKNSICFYQNNSLLAIMHLLSDTANASDAWKQQQTVCILKKIPYDYLLLILSFPLLQIGI